jgi:signal transduction histidine kinase/HPt (histidine-containing phosphotransfer) domain-containing protein
MRPAITPENRWKRISLAASITNKIFIGALIFSIGISLLINHAAQRQLMTMANSRVSYVVKTQAASAGAALWAFDPNLMNVVLVATTEDDYIRSARIIDTSGGPEGKVAAEKGPAFPPSGEHVLSYPIVYAQQDTAKSRELGRLEVVVDYSRLDAQIRDMTLILFGGALLTLTIMTLMAYAVIDREIKPVRTLSGSLASDEDEELPMDAKNSKVFEVNQLFYALASMQKRTHEHNALLVEEKNKAETAQQKAEVANQSKTEFLANMSHELRTPLNSIIGLTDMLIEEQMDAEHRDMVEIVKKSSSNLLEIVNDILDLSKIDNMGVGLVLENAAFDFHQPVHDIVEVLAPLASQKGISLSQHFSQEIPFLIGDQVRIKRILMNLISNAIKYTIKGSVDVIIGHRLFDSGRRAEVTVQIRDTGIGIPEDKFDKIFEKFTQADESTTRKFGGTGLGLTIAKKLTEMMGGRISVASKVGVGSTFSLTVPFQVTDKLEEEDTRGADAPVIREEVRVPIEKVRILLAEDYELNQVFMKKLFSVLGIPPADVAPDGLQAVSMWRKGTYDLILMDCHMPRMSGYGAVSVIRKEETGSGRHIPIVAMTADVMSGTREKCVKAGMDDYISKPVDKVKLVSLLSRWIEFPEQGGKQKPASPAAAAEPVVDLTHVKAFSGGDVESERAFVTIFLEQSELSIASLKDNLTDGENKAWAETMHHLKGGCAMMGAGTLRDLCEKGQNQMQASASARAELLDEINASYAHVKEFLQKVYAA